MLSFPPVSTSHAHPLPKRVTPALLICSLKESKLPKVDLIESASAPVGAPPAFGPIHVQNSEWFM